MDDSCHLEATSIYQMTASRYYDYAIIFDELLKLKNYTIFGCNFQRENIRIYRNVKSYIKCLFNFFFFF